LARKPRGDAHDAPAGRTQPAIPFAIQLEGGLGIVGGAGVELHDKPVLRPHEVEFAAEQVEVRAGRRQTMPAGEVHEERLEVAAGEVLVGVEKLSGVAYPFAVGIARDQVRQRERIREALHWNAIPRPWQPIPGARWPRRPDHDPPIGVGDRWFATYLRQDVPVFRASRRAGSDPDHRRARRIP
jgi:hypothetical protein